MSPEEIKERILKTYPTCEVKVLDFTGNLDHFRVNIITKPDFPHKTHLEKHKAIMDLFKVELKSGEIHAFSLKFDSLAY